MNDSKWPLILSRFKRKQLPLDVEHCSPLALRNIVLDVRTPGYMLEQIAFAYNDDDSLMRELVRCPNLMETTLVFIAMSGTDDLKQFIVKTRVVEMVMEEPLSPKKPDEEGKPEEKKKLNIAQIIMKMTPSQKIKTAITGGKEARGLLIREASKLIGLAVIANPKLTVGEVEFFAKSTSLNEDVLRKIARNSEWTKRPLVASALVNNPKTPVGISMSFLPRLSMQELVGLERSKNIPAAVRLGAKNLIIKKKLGK